MALVCVLGARRGAGGVREARDQQLAARGRALAVVSAEDAPGLSTGTRTPATVAQGS